MFSWGLESRSIESLKFSVSRTLTGPAVLQGSGSQEDAEEEAEVKGWEGQPVNK